MKKPIKVGKVLSFNGGGRKYRIIKSDGICWGDKGYTLICQCIKSDSPAMIGEEYTFDDRVFRDYNENNIVIENAA